MTTTTVPMTTVATMATTDPTRRQPTVTPGSTGPDEPTEQLDVVTPEDTAGRPTADSPPDTRFDGTRTGDTRTGDTRTGDTRTGDTRTGETPSDGARRTDREVVLRIPVPDLAGAWSRSREQVSGGLRGIRGRVVLGYVVLVAGALIVSLVVVRQVLLVQTDRSIEASLVQEVEELRRLSTGVDPETGEPFGADTAGIFDTFLARNVPSEGEVFLTIVDGAPHLETRGPADLTDDAGLVARWSALEQPLRLDVGSGPTAARTLAVPLTGPDGTTAGVFVVAVFPQDALADVDRAVRVIGGVGLLVLIAAALVAFALARRVLRPVEELTETSRRISDNDLTARFDVDGDDELARLGESFNDMLDRLERGFAAQREVLDDVAHELRTPITIVRGHLELLDDDPAARAETVSLCLDELDRMGRYVNELLLVASASRPDFLSLGPVDVGELADGLLARVEQLGDRDWVLLEAPRPGSVIIEADEQRLTQVVVNLAANAVQHTAEGSRIELAVTASPSADEVRLSVRDHGPGVAPDVRDQVFHRFSRGTGSRTDRPEGTGLGLAIVTAIAEAHGGRVLLEDPPGGGARFVVVVPTPSLDDPLEAP